MAVLHEAPIGAILGPSVFYRHTEIYVGETPYPDVATAQLQYEAPKSP